MNEVKTNAVDGAVVNAVKSVRQPQHDGVFYPADALILQHQLDDCLRQADTCSVIGGSSVNERIKAIVVPHAGYDYSAHIAAQAYAALRGQDWIKRVVILAPNHQTAVQGGLTCSHDTWATPLGEVEIDQPFIAEHWSSLSQVTIDDAVHQAEYSIEVQLPFIQCLRANVPIVPILLGECTPQQMAAILYPIWSCADTLIIVSSDLYHYLPYAAALPAGMALARAIEQNDITHIRPETACGYVALRGVMQLAQTESSYWRTLAVGHSGQNKSIPAAGLVGYGAFLLITPAVCRAST